MDLSGFDIVSDANQGAELLLTLKDGRPAIDDDGVQLALVLVGQDSDKYRAAVRAQANFRLDRQARGENGPAGAQPLTFTEIAAWAALSLAAPTAFEVALLCRLDDVFLASLPKPEAFVDGKPASFVPISNGEGVRTMIGDIAAANA